MFNLSGYQITKTAVIFMLCNLYSHCIVLSIILCPTWAMPTSIYFPPSLQFCCINTGFNIFCFHLSALLYSTSTLLSSLSALPVDYHIHLLHKTHTAVFPLGWSCSSRGEAHTWKIIFTCVKLFCMLAKHSLLGCFYVYWHQKGSLGLSTYSTCVHSNEQVKCLSSLHMRCLKI